MNAIPIAVLRRLAAHLAASADEIDANTATVAFDVEEATERKGFAASIRFIAEVE